LPRVAPAHGRGSITQKRRCIRSAVGPQQPCSGFLGRSCRSDANPRRRWAAKQGELEFPATEGREQLEVDSPVAGWPATSTTSPRKNVNQPPGLRAVGGISCAILDAADGRSRAPSGGDGLRAQEKIGRCKPVLRGHGSALPAGRRRCRIGAYRVDAGIMREIAETTTSVSGIHAGETRSLITGINPFPQWEKRKRIAFSSVTF